MSKQELYLYRFKVELVKSQTLDLVVLAATDEQAFDSAAAELERSCFPAPTAAEWVIEEKKRVRRGVGYVFGC